ncbi:MAG: MFS transporter, partial [Acidobacteriota bacterium]|nr:MFS transporter [Acidobacteriota bacterium]
MRLNRLRWLILILLFTSTMINYVDRQALSVLLPALRADLGLSSAAYGTITTLFLVAYTISQVGFGVLIDKIGTRLGFALSIVVWSIAAMLHAFAGGALSLGILRFALGLGEAGNWPAGGKAISQWFP